MISKINILEHIRFLIPYKWFFLTCLGVGFAFGLTLSFSTKEEYVIYGEIELARVGDYVEKAYDVALRLTWSEIIYSSYMRARDKLAVEPGALDLYKHSLRAKPSKIPGVVEITLRGYTESDASILFNATIDQLIHDQEPAFKIAFDNVSKIIEKSNNNISHLEKELVKIKSLRSHFEQSKNYEGLITVIGTQRMFENELTIAYEQKATYAPLISESKAGRGRVRPNFEIVIKRVYTTPIITGILGGFVGLFVGLFILNTRLARDEMSVNKN